jgi:hypothetical protein
MVCRDEAARGFRRLPSAFADKLRRMACCPSQIFSEVFFMKKAAAPLLAAAFLLSGCAKNAKIEGADVIENFRDTVTGYQSARYFLTDTQNDVLEEVFTFRYDGDVMVYLHDKKYSREFGDASGLYFDDLTDGEEPYVFAKGDSGFEVYTRENPHPYADAQLLFYVRGYIAESSVLPGEGGSVVYEYKYDVDGINKELGRTYTEFITQYVFDEDGDFIYFLQSNSSFAEEKIQSHSYMVEIGEINNISSIKNPMK